MTEPNEQLLEGKTPTITVSHKEWPVPLLAPKQNRIVVPIIMKRAVALSGIAKAGKLSITKLTELMSTELYDDLAEVVFVALTRAHKITRHEFDDMPIETLELIEAFFTIAQQTGLIRAARPGEETMGEEAAADQALTGTP